VQSPCGPSEFRQAAFSAGFSSPSEQDLPNPHLSFHQIDSSLDCTLLPTARYTVRQGETEKGPHKGRTQSLFGYVPQSATKQDCVAGGVGQLMRAHPILTAMF
jgi:hypothetical protein